MRERQNVCNLSATPWSRRRPGATCTSGDAPEILRPSTETKGAFCKGKEPDPTAPNRGRPTLTVTTTMMTTTTVIKTMASFYPRRIVCCGQNAARTKPVMSASERQGLFSGFLGSPPEIPIPI